MKNRILFLFFAIAAACHRPDQSDSLALIQIQDRNDLTETISNPDRLTVYQAVDFFSSQPYKKVLRVYKAGGKNRSKITTYHANGIIWQYLEAEEMRAHGAYREWFPNGQLKIEASVIGGTADIAQESQENWLFDSLSQVWDEQGNLIATIPYQKGLLEGTSVYFYPSGQVQKEVPFASNQMEGEAVSFSPEGTLLSKIQYKKGIKDAESLGFFNEGALAWIENYSDGALCTGDYYNSQGELVAEIKDGRGFQALYEGNALTLIEFRAGKPEGLVKKFTSAGELQRSFYMENGKKKGEEVAFYLAPQKEREDKNISLPKLSLMWHENRIHGPVKTWYNNGQLQSQREYSNNQRSGPSLAWYRDGSLMLVEEYEEDRLFRGQYFKIRKSEPVTTIINGGGLATFYDEAGVFLRKISYSKGKPVDPEN